MNATVDRRVLAGFRCVDAITGATVAGPLSVMAAPLGILRNRSGVFAVMDAPGVNRSDTQTLTPLAWPPPVVYPITIQDPSLRYLPRQAKISVPQPMPPTVALGAPATTTAAPGAPPPVPPVTTPQTVTLYPAPNAPVEPNWAVVRAVVSNNASSPLPLAGAVVQISVASAVAATGVTNRHGEALLAVPGIGLKLSSSTTNPVLEATTAATATVWFDPAALNQAAGVISNPDDILLNLSNTQWKSTSLPVTLTPGMTVVVSLTVSM